MRRKNDPSPPRPARRSDQEVGGLEGGRQPRRQDEASPSRRPSPNPPPAAGIGSLPRPVGNNTSRTHLPSFKDQAQTVIVEGRDVPAASATNNNVPDDKSDSAPCRRSSQSDPPAFRFPQSASTTTPRRPVFDQEEKKQEDSTHVYNKVVDSIDDQPPPFPAAAERSLSRAVLPSYYKDQSRRHEADVMSAEPVPDDDNQIAGARGSSRPQAKVLPSYKDQSRRHEADVVMSAKPVPDENNDKQIAGYARGSSSGKQPQQRGEEPTGSNYSNSSVGGGGVPLINAHLVDNDSGPTTPNNGSVYTANAFALNGAVLVRRRSLIAIAGIFLVAVATVGGVCGAGKCAARDSPAPARSSSSTNPLRPAGSSTTPTPTTLSPPTDSPTFLVRTASILDFVSSITFTNRTIRYPAPSDTTVTPEEMAVQWLIDDDPLQLSAVETADQARLTQRYSLAAFYFSTNGDFWTLLNNGWLVEEDECAWRGITCLSTEKTVINIDLKERNLNTGDRGFSDDFALLRNLTLVDLAGNPNLHGPLPTSIGNLENLQFIDFSRCGLWGTLPETVGRWTKLRGFVVNQCEYDCEDDDDCFDIDCTNFATGSGFTGTLPSSIDQWTALELM